MDQQNKIEAFYMSLREPLRGTLLFLREAILHAHPQLKETWKYGMPFFCLDKKMFCYFWFDQNDRSKPYIGFADGYRIEHPMLEQGNRKRMKIFRFDPAEDIAIGSLQEIMHMALLFY